MSTVIWGPTSRGDISGAEIRSRLQRASDMLRVPFSSTSMTVVDALSKRLLRSSYSRSAPQIMALGYWLRTSAIKQLQVQFEKSSNASAVQVPRGLAYHLPPANVETLFIYSWVLSFLVGNNNVVRIPSEPSTVATWLLGELLSVLGENNMLDSQLFCSFDRESDMGAVLSSMSDLRVIWGGDEKVAQVSADPVKPDGLTVGFSDRKSLCLIKTAEYKKLDKAGRLTLAENFFNDVFWFDQLGCGSPRVVIWVGRDRSEKKEFYELLLNKIEEKGYQVDCHVDISKLVFSNELVGRGVVQRAKRCSPELTVMDSDLNSETLEYIHGGGVLFQMSMAELSNINSVVRRDLQTITTYGFDKGEKISLAKILNGRGGYRIVPVGSALAFNSIWDGIDLMSHFSRQITIA